MSYSNTNAHLYDDIALWEKTDGRDLFLEMPLQEKQSPRILDFGYGFGEQLFALANAYPQGKIYGIDANPVCQKEVGGKLRDRGLDNVTQMVVPLNGLLILFLLQVPSVFQRTAVRAQQLLHNVLFCHGFFSLPVVSEVVR